MHTHRHTHTHTHTRTEKNESETKTRVGGNRQHYSDHAKATNIGDTYRDRRTKLH